EIRLPLLCLAEWRRRRQILRRLRQRGAEPRDLHAHRALLVERHRLGDGRRDEQKLLKLEAEFRREPLWRDLAAPRRALQRVMDLLAEALDLERRAGRDLVLVERQLVAALLVAEIDLDDAARDQSAADEQYGDQEIFAHEPAPRPARAEDIWKL